jgi:NADH pyrophosphatase NudC (nudix superfamily)
MNTQDTREKLIHAYEKMLERVHHLWGAGEGQHSLKQAILHARDKAEELQEITREDANKVADYVSRDLHEMGSYLHETGKELRDWFRFDVELIEDRLLEKLVSVADKTRIELASLQEHNREVSQWHTGEVTGPGTLICCQCGEPLHFKKTGHIPPCPKCHETAFKREV